ncbi:MAG: thiosulfate dehydrogenase (quinone) large subunit, partial [Actinomycetota bacterium]|nr:thiosulfate dehydrogenase (quinone) large subunit [Actinomycetota bacterium]
MSVLESWRSQPYSLRLLRGFLGITFTYAGVQKLSDPGFLSASSPTYIGTQLTGFARGSPIAWLLHPMMHFPVAIGLAVVVAELAVGLGTLIGVAPLTMAVGGSLISVLLWLSATWHIHPYFLGSDSVYAVAWVALAIGVWELRSSRIPTLADASESAETSVDRRAFLRSGVLAGAIVAIGAAAKIFARDSLPVAALDQQAPAGSSAAATPKAPTVQGQEVANLKDLVIGKPQGFTDAGGQPAVVMRLSDTEVVAYSRVCTHAGCIVDYDSTSKLLY